MAVRIIRLADIDSADYISPYVLEQVANQTYNPEEISPDDVQRAKEAGVFISIVDNGFIRVPTVFKHKGGYRILDGEDIVAACVYKGKEKMPAEVLPSDHPDIPTLIRKSH